MAKLPFSLGLATVIFTFILCTAQVNLDEVFTIQSGRTDGGCDRFYNQAAQTGVLDDWLSEISYSLDYALSAIEDYNGDICHTDRYAKPLAMLLVQYAGPRGNR
ncbi:hypothetical protein F4824DRAFT_503269 [Ustulina deusta]|nr:hypothetical protein F4824DRAFT_503269 [Ustulina deusta]